MAEYDREGRVVAEHSELFWDEPAERTVRDTDYTWGEHGLERKQTHLDRNPWGSELVFSEESLTEWEYRDDGTLALESHQGHTESRRVEYDEQGREVLRRVWTDEGCTETRSEWDGSTFTRLDWIDEGCTGDWVEDGGGQYTDLWLPRWDLDAPRVELFWDGELLVRVDDAYQGRGLEVEYGEDGRPVYGYNNLPRTDPAEIWPDYDEQGRIWQQRHLSDQGWTVHRLLLNAVGGVEERITWSEEYQRFTRSSYVSDARHNLTEVYDDHELLYEYSFDCHPAQ